METQLLEIVPVLPSANIERDIKWYGEKLDFELVGNDERYAVLRKEELTIHLQWHADTDDDPLLGGSVIRIFVKNIYPIFEAYVQKGTVPKSKLRENTPWKTNEFGLYDLNNNALFFVQDL